MGPGEKGRQTPMRFAQQLERHYSERWSLPIGRMRLNRGPIWDLPDEFEVVLFPHSEKCTAYATLCMSQPEDDERLELFLLTTTSEKIRDELVELLTAVAHYHRTGARL